LTFRYGAEDLPVRRSRLAELFSTGRVRVEKDEEDLRDRLYQEIGQLKVELDWLKKKVPTSR
jgi:putative transposase